MFRDFRFGWRGLWRKGEVNREVEEELRAYVDSDAEARRGAGMSREEAARSARVEAGSLDAARERMLGVGWENFLESWWHDLVYAGRMLRKSPGFAFAAVLTLALGIGATTIMFTVINGVLLKPMPYPEPDRLVTLQEQTGWSNQFGNLWAFAYPNYVDVKREARSLEMAAWRFSGGTVSGAGGAEYVDARQISSELFPVLGVKVAQGRGFLPEEDQIGGAPVMIVSNGLAQRLFSGSAGAIGSPLVFNGKSYTIVGIAPAGLRLEDEEADVFTPLGHDLEPNLRNRERHPGIRVVARLRPGATAAQAQTDLALIGRHLEEAFPGSNKGRGFVAERLRPNVGDVQSTLWLLLGAVSLVLLIACVNVASLLLARAVSRERELAMRVALGATRRRLVRQCLTESALLGLLGGALGVLLAAIGIHPFISFWPGSLPRAQEVRLDWHVLVFAVGVSLLSGVLFGLAPALRAPTRELEQKLRAGARTVAGSSRRLHSGFVVSEIALAVVLLVAAGILGRTMLRMASLDPGVNVRNVLVTRMALSPATLANPAQTRAVWDDVLARARRVPGVESVALVDTVPMREGNNELGYSITPDMAPEDKQPIALATSVTPDYLKVMGIPLLKGRFFDDHDRIGNEPVVVIDDVLAQQAFGKEEAIGKRLWFPGPSTPFEHTGNSPGAVRVVGVVGHVRHWGLASDDQAQVRAQIYYPFAQVTDGLVRRWSELTSVAVRTSVAPLSVADPLRREVRGVTGDQVLYEVRTMEQLASGTLGLQRFLLLLFGIFGGLALLLACIGIYGVMAYLTSQRVPEIGVRMALGANARDVVRLVLRQSVGMVAAGIGVGVVAALAAARLLEHLVPGVRTMEPVSFAAMVLTLGVAALGASFLPARRASRVDPVRALRQE